MSPGGTPPPSPRRPLLPPPPAPPGRRRHRRQPEQPLSRGAAGLARLSPFPSLPFPRLSPVPIYSCLCPSQPGERSVPAGDRKDKIRAERRGATLQGRREEEEAEAPPSGAAAPGAGRAPRGRPSRSPFHSPPPSLRGGAGRAWLRRCRGRAWSPTPAPAARAAREGELRADGGARGSCPACAEVPRSSRTS